MPDIKKLKKTILLFLAASCYFVSNAQKNYVPGYVITKSKDTIRGFIDYRNWQNNPVSISFKTDNDKDPVSFHADKIAEFGIPGEIYVSGIIETEISPLSINKLEPDANLRIETDTAFLQAMFRGKKELYYYKNKDGRENFYISQNNAFTLLVHKKYLEEQEGKNVIREYNEYIKQLSLYLNDCATIQSVLKNTSYNRKDLFSLFRYYYTCSQSVNTFIKKQEKPFFAIGFLAGGSLTFLKFRSNAFSRLVNTDFSQSVNPSIGLSFDYVFPKNQGKWSINNELLFSSYHVSGKYTDYKHENQYSIINTEFDYSYLKLNNLVRYKYPIGSAFMFVNAGMSNGIAISEANHRNVFTKFYTDETMEDEPALESARKYEQGLVLGIGIKLKKLSFEIRVEKGNGMSVNSALASSTTRFHLLAGYRFR
jgi:hypothetical protein